MRTMRSLGTFIFSCQISKASSSSSINRHPEFFLGQFDYVNQIFPGPGDGFFLEIIAEGKIAEHFEKGMMAGGDADIFQIVMFAAGADAFLAG